MADVDEIIDYIKSLKKGFDKDLFQNKIDELAYAVDTIGLDYNDFHILVKVWLNLSIPITKWVTLGASLVPQNSVREITVKYALSWILCNYQEQSLFSRTSFVLDWFTAAMECELIDMDQLDLGYEVFYSCLTYETLTPHAVKLIYTLTKPSDVTRSRVVELLNYAKIREGKKNMCRQLQVLLGLFKSYRPECVPEDVPAISIHTAFKKIDANLLERFKRNQKRSNNLSRDIRHWIRPEYRKNTKADSLVPNIEYIDMGSRHNKIKELEKTFLDYTDAASVLRCGTERWSARPARLRALLCDETGVVLLALAPRSYQAFLSHDLHHLLNTCFFETSSHSYTEKQDLLRRLSMLQSTLMQGIPVVTRFLAQYLPLWNEKDYFSKIMDLVQWVSVDTPDHVMSIVQSLTRIYHRAQLIEQCAILGSLNIMYSNLMYCSTRSRHHFMDAVPENKYKAVLPEVAAAITCMCTKELQVNPGDVVVLHSVVSSAVHRARNSMRYSAAGGLEPVSPLSLALPLVSVSAMLIDKVASLMILYRRLLSQLKNLNKVQKEDIVYCEQIQLLEAYTEDLANCLYTEEVFSARKNGFVFAKLHPQLVGKLMSLMPDADSKFSIQNNMAFWTDTYFALDENYLLVADNKSLFKSVIDPTFTNLSKLLKNIVRELSY